MPETLANLQKKILDYWNNFDNSQKTRMIITSVIMAAVAAIAIYFLTKPNYVPLLTINDSKNKSEIVRVLDSEGIRYKAGDLGRILVDSRDKTKAEFSLSVEGLTTSGMEFEDAWNLIEIASTESDKKRLWNNMLKQSIRAKLLMFDNIKDADIEIALPKETIFVEKSSDKAKASVIIVPTGEITREQAQAIVRVVASSIVGLEPADVTLVDNDLNELSIEGSDSYAGISSNQYQMKLKVKEEMEKSVKNLFGERSESFDTIRVVANPILDFDRKKSTTSEIKKPTDLEEAVVSEQTKKESLEDGQTASAPGTDSNPETGNVPGYPVGNSGNSTFDSKEETINRLFTEVLTEEEKSLGEIDFEKSSFAITFWFGQRIQDDSNLTSEFFTQVKQDISRATGIPEANISANKYKQSPVEITEKNTSEFIQELIDSYGVFAVMFLLLLGLIVVARPGKSGVGQKSVPAYAGGQAIDVLSEISDNIPSIDTSEKSEVKKQLEKFVKQKPDAVAQLLRNWLSEE